MEISPAKAIVLMYHRVEKPDTDPWNICVSPQHFEEQISFIKQNFPVININELLQQVKAKNIRENCVCITFDDGYADNVINALPVLTDHKCPATFFIASAYIGNPHPFWWDELELICLHTKQLPAVLELPVNGKIHYFFFEKELTEEQWQQHKAWKWYEAPATERCDSFLKLWNLLRPMPASFISNVMQELRDWSGTSFRQRLAMDDNQLRLLAQSPLATLGLHTCTHMDLQGKSITVQAEEITQGKDALAKHCNTEANLLAYPYGRYDNNTVTTVSKLKLKAAFTTEPLPVTAASDSARLGRYGAGDWNVKQFGEYLASWFAGE